MAFDHWFRIHPGGVNGMVETARDAARACEECYDSLLAGTHKVIPPEAFAIAIREHDTHRSRINDISQIDGY